MADAVSLDYEAVASVSARELASRLGAAERMPSLSVSYSDLIILNDLVAKCGSDMLKLRASAFAKQREHDAALAEAALRHDRDISAIKQLAVGQKDIALRDFEGIRHTIRHSAQKDYDVLCKMYNAEKANFERMKVPMPRTSSLSQATSSADAGISFMQALSEWKAHMVIPSPNAPLYVWSYLGVSVALGLILESFVAGFVLGLVVPTALYLLFIKAQLKLQSLAPALDRDRAKIARRMEDSLREASKRLNPRQESIDAILGKELAEHEEKKAKDLQNLRSGHESALAKLKHAVSSIDAEMLELLVRLRRLEAAWQLENRQAAAAFSEKSLEWEVPAPRLLRLGNLSLTSKALVQGALASENP
jgi:hypothetical protein